MAYVNVADWKSEQVAEWLKGLDDIVLPYIHSFLYDGVNGQQLLDLQPDDLDHLGVTKLGHQEIILEAVELLRNFHYELDRENLQLLALRLSCLARNVYNELFNHHSNSSVVPTQVLADTANVVTAVKPLVCWLDRSPFSGQLSYIDKKNDLLKLSLEMATSGQRDRFADNPVENIKVCCKQLADLADSIIQDVDDSLLLQPASLDLATLKKRPGDHVGFYVVPSFHGIHQVGELKCNSAAHQSGKIEAGDEIVQINYQTVVGWQVKDVMGLLFEENSTEILLTLKKRPKHSKVFGQIYIKPYRLPCKKQITYATRWHDLLPSRPQPFINHFEVPFGFSSSVKPGIKIKESKSVDRAPPSPTGSTSSSSSSSESELAGPSSPNSVRLYLPKPRIPVQRRATITGASPVSKHAPLSLEQFWHELKLEKEWRSNSREKQPQEKAISEIELKHSGSKTTHSSLSWSVRLCDQNDIKMNNRESGPSPSASFSSSSSLSTIPIKKRIESFDRIADNANRVKPKLFPKPVLKEKCEIPTIHRERGKLDKSYSTPSYDYSADDKENKESGNVDFDGILLKGRIKALEDGLKTIEDEKLNVNQHTDEKLTSLEEENVIKDERRNKEPTDEEIKLVKNDYLEIKNEEVQVNNKILDTISTLQNMDTNDMPCPPIPSPRTKDIQIPLELPPRISKKPKPKEDPRSEKLHKLDISLPLERPMEIQHEVVIRPEPLPPVPPPRPLKPSTQYKSTSKPNALIKSLNRNALHKSPRLPRKKNQLIAKRRNITIKELIPCDHEGWLYNRSRRIKGGSPYWIKGWFIIKGTIFYGFNSKESTRARLMISLPGFTVSPAEEVKSRHFAFKVYHTGKTFYFAAECVEDLTGWVDSFARVTISDEEQTAIITSETDGEEDEEKLADENESNSGSSRKPTIKKITGLIAAHWMHSQDGKSDKKFHSLKKGSSRKSHGDDVSSDQVASLDRKYLRFLGGGSKQNMTPVPTAQFRSYRRITPMDKPLTTNPTDNTPPPEQCTVVSNLTSVKSASPTRPPDMADYRLASLTKANTNPTRVEEADGHMTLETFMLNRQEEERRHPRSNVLRVPQCHAPPPPDVLSSAVNDEPSAHHFSPTFQQMEYRADEKGITERSRGTPRPKTRGQLKSSHSHLNEPPNSEDRLQPAFEMALDRSNQSSKKIEESRFRSFFGGSKNEKVSGSPRLKRVLFRDRANQETSNEQILNKRGYTESVAVTPTVLHETPDYPELEYPPVFEPETYSLQDLSTILCSQRLRHCRSNQPTDDDVCPSDISLSEITVTAQINNTENGNEQD